MEFDDVRRHVIPLLGDGWERQAKATREGDARDGLQQYEILWILPWQYALSTCPNGFAIELLDFLGPGDPDFRGKRTIWVRGPVVDSILKRGRLIAVAVPHDQPRARRTGGEILPPPIPTAFARRVRESGLAERRR
jgi:hypothetical protein